MWTYKCDRCGAALDPGERCDCQDRPAKYNGKPIFTQENFNYSEAKIGDYVEQAVVDDAMDCLPPASMSARCAQMGEPYSHREDPETGRLRPTYYTFRGISVKITYNLQVLPQRKNSRKDSEETTALKAFLADSEKKNMVFEYDTPQEAKKRYDSMRNYRNANKLQDIYDMWRSDALICIVKTKKGAAKK